MTRVPASAMELVHTLARGATKPIRLGLSAGGIGLSVSRSVLEEARRALVGQPSRSEGWTRPRPPRVWSPGPEVRARGRSASTAPIASSAGSEAATATPEAAVPPPRPIASSPGSEAATATPEAAVPPPPVSATEAQGPAVPVMPPPGAKQVDDEPVQVAESAERGAEDGAGAEVRIDPPWDGYDALTAADIRDRLVAADAALATAVALYEGSGRGRVSVVRAAERRLGAVTS